MKEKLQILAMVCVAVLLLYLIIFMSRGDEIPETSTRHNDTKVSEHSLFHIWQSLPSLQYSCIWMGKIDEIIDSQVFKSSGKELTEGIWGIEPKLVNCCLLARINDCGTSYRSFGLAFLDTPGIFTQVKSFLGKHHSYPIVGEALHYTEVYENGKFKYIHGNFTTEGEQYLRTILETENGAWIGTPETIQTLLSMLQGESSGVVMNDRFCEFSPLIDFNASTIQIFVSPTAIHDCIFKSTPKELLNSYIEFQLQESSPESKSDSLSINVYAPTIDDTASGANTDDGQIVNVIYARDKGIKTLIRHRYYKTYKLLEINKLIFIGETEDHMDAVTGQLKALYGNVSRQGNIIEITIETTEIRNECLEGVPVF